MQLVHEYRHFLRHHIGWWLLPPIVILAALYALVRFGGDGSVAGFVYNV